MRKKTTKRSLLASVLALALCVIMLVGTTFAWFTDTSSTGANKIVSGKLDVALEMKDGGNWVSAEGKTLEFVKAKDAPTNEKILWEPGCRYKLPELRISNKGNLALKYKVVISGIQGNAKLNEVIDWTMNGETLDAAALGTEMPLGVGESKEFTIMGHMQESAGNEYMALSIDGIAITVYATQDTVENDSFDNKYDEGATLPSVVTTTVIAGEDSVLKNTEKKITVTVPANAHPNVKALQLHIEDAETPANITVSSTQDTYTAEVTLKNQDGNKVKADGSVLYTVEMDIGKNRTGVTVFHSGVKMTNDGTALKGVADHFVYDKTSGIITMKVSSFSPFTCVFNKDNWTDHVTEDYATPVDETNKIVTIASAEDLALLAKKVNEGTSYSGYTVNLTNDIDLANHMWTPIGKSGKTFQGKFDGNNKTIRNLLVGSTWASDVGLFGVTTNGEIKNLTVENATVKGYLDVGVVAGTPYTSKYTNIKVCGDVYVDGYAYVGGVFGKNAYANLTDITVDASEDSYVKADSQNYRTYVGGVVGFMGEGNQIVSNVNSNIDVYGSTCDVGGITGIAHYGNQFINCVCTGDVTLGNASDKGDHLEIGGIAGVWLNTKDQTVTFTDCSFTGKLSTTLNGVDKTADLNDGYYEITGKKYTSGSNDGKLIINGIEVSNH